MVELGTEDLQKLTEAIEDLYYFEFVYGECSIIQFTLDSTLLSMTSW